MAQFSKRRRNRHSKNKTRRYKKKGGMHKHDLDSKKKYMKTGAYISMGVTPIGDPPIGDPPIGDPPIGDPLSSVPPEVPNDALMMSHRSFALASILNRAHDAQIPFTKSRSKMETKLYEPTGHLAVAIEGERYQIKVNAVAPGAKTRMTENLLGELGGMLGPEFVSPVVLALAHSSCNVSGEVFLAAGGRVARVFSSQNLGIFSKELTPEFVAQNFELLISQSERLPVETVDQEMQVLIDLLKSHKEA